MVQSQGVVLNPRLIYPEADELRVALAERNWPAARAVLDRVRPAERSALIRIGAEGNDLERLLRGVLADDPDDTTAGALLGAHLTEVGWRVRTGYRARHVGARQFAVFHDWLRKAEQVLIDAAARNPRDAAVWVSRLPTARGLELGQSEARRRYDRLAAIDPHHPLGQRHLLQQLCPKWGGSWEQAHTFAREAMLAAPPGAHAAALVAEGHVEHWLEIAGDLERRRYLAYYHPELVEAALRSIWHPDFRRTIGWVHAAGVFAMAFCLAGDPRAAASCFGLLGDFCVEWPWNYLPGDPAAVIGQWRAWARSAPGAVTR